MNFLILFASFIFLTAGLVFIYKPTWIVKINKFLRERIFNDTLILLERRKKGFFFILMFFVLFYWGYNRCLYQPNLISRKLIPIERVLYEAQHHIHLDEYAEAQKLCAGVLMSQPNNADAHYLLAASQYLMNDPAASKISWAQARSLGASPQTEDRLRKMIVRHKHLPSEDIPELR